MPPGRMHMTVNIYGGQARTSCEDEPIFVFDGWFPNQKVKRRRCNISTISTLNAERLNLNKKRIEMLT
jgi:hypothetical protein